MGDGGRTSAIVETLSEAMSYEGSKFRVRMRGRALRMSRPKGRKEYQTINVTVQGSQRRYLREDVDLGGDVAETDESIKVMVMNRRYLGKTTRP